MIIFTEIPYWYQKMASMFLSKVSSISPITNFFLPKFIAFLKNFSALNLTKSEPTCNFRKSETVVLRVCFQCTKICQIVLFSGLSLSCVTNNLNYASSKNHAKSLISKDFYITQKFLRKFGF